MSLPWVRLDSAFNTNPKVLELVADKQWRPIVSYVCSLAYAGAHGTDGFIPKSALPFIHATAKDAEELVAARLWVPAPGGWDVNSWDEFQPSNEETKKRKHRAQEAAAARWNKKKGDAE